MKHTAEMLAGYNAWANGRIYDAAEQLPDEDYRADLGAFFGSVHRTLNHILTADYIWMHRFTGEGPNPTRLDAIQHERLADLRRAREEEDARISAYFVALNEWDLAGRFTYRTIVDPALVTLPRIRAVMHFFNHQTHHRGQVHALLTRLMGEAPSLDMIVFQREAGLSKVTPI